MRITGPFVGLEQFVTENAPLAKFTWFKIGGPARWLVRPRNVEELAEATRRCIENNIPIYVLGLGANLLISDEFAVQNNKMRKFQLEMMIDPAAEVQPGTLPRGSTAAFDLK